MAASTMINPDLDLSNTFDGSWGDSKAITATYNDLLKAAQNVQIGQTTTTTDGTQYWQPWTDTTGTTNSKVWTDGIKLDINEILKEIYKDAPMPGFALPSEPKPKSKRKYKRKPKICREVNRFTDFLK